MVFRITGIQHQSRIHSGKVKQNRRCNLKTQEQRTLHSDEKPATVKVRLQDRIEEILDMATNPSNFKRVFNMGEAISIKELLHYQKRDKFCRKLAKSLHEQSNFKINHEGLLVKQIIILRNIY